jgi:enterochelin esterase-like enzyme
MRRPAIAILIALLLVPAAHASESAVQSFAIDDTTYGLQRTVWLYQSAGTTGSPMPPYNLFVFLQREYIDELAIPATLQKLVASGEIPPTIAVVLDTSTERPSDIANRAKFDRMLTANLLPWLRAKLGRLPEPKNVVIAGFSVGGLTAAYLAYRHPDVFGNVFAQSGAFWRGNEGSNDPPEWLTNELRDKPRLPLRFYIEVGSEETRRLPNGVIFVEASRHLRDVLARKGYVFQYSEVPRNIHDPEHLLPTINAGIVYLSKPAAPAPRRSP